MTSPSPADLRAGFAELHAAGGFVLPNAWDRGTLLRFTERGYPAVATTSAGYGRSIGKDDQEVTLDELVAHVADLAAVATVPINVDSERLFPDGPGGITGTVDALADAGASGVSIEDYDPVSSSIVDRGAATEAVGEAAEACARHGITLTARAENFLYGVDDLDDTLERLVAYREAGARCLYAPGPTDSDAIRAIVDAAGDAAVNVLTMPGGPRSGDLFELGVRRVSTGSWLHHAAMQAVDAALDDV